jgi:6-pyruvoyltetrahydropterin/6-carboxytetrahydropterin synthase
MTVSITRRFEWDAAHRVLGHEGKCRHLHGHRYVAEVTVAAPELDSLGRVVDFSVLKEKLGEWIDTHWDHNAILHPDDPLVELLENQHLSRNGRHPWTMNNLRGLHERNPTAENIAAQLAYTASQLLMHLSLEVVHVRVYETPNCFADYRPSR